MLIKISLRIIFIFGIALIMSFIPDLYPKQFGDWLCEGSIHYYGANSIKECMHSSSPHNAEWHWGYRHWVWFLMGLSLFFLQIRDIIITIRDEQIK